MAEFHKTARVKMRLGEQLVAAGLISSDALQDALRHAREEGLRLGEYLVGAGIVTEAEVLRAVASQLHVPVYNKDTFPIEEKLASVIPADFARRHRVVPLCMRRGVLYAGLLDAHDFQTLDEIEELTHCQMEPVLCLRADFVRLFTAVYGEYSAVGEMLDNLGDSPRAQSGVQGGVQDQEIEGDASEVPVIKLVNLIISEALKKGASDIHINPEKNEIKVRYRVEGLLRRASTIPVSMGSAVASRVKIMGNMDISETRLPQDGRFTVKAEGREVNVRVSTLPTTYGENIVLRLLDMASGIIYDLPKLGMNQADYASLTRCARKPYGMILSTGPTGSGKSSSLYAILKMLNREDVNIITLEDPVEYRLPGVRQVQLNVKAGMTFSSGLRSILRQDPDIIMVGEIRDKETAEIAVQAAMTGHLVLSTLHTNDALSAVYRLVDMGVPAYLVTSVLLCTFAQRLVRTVCPHCREEYMPNEAMLRDLGLRPEDGPFYHGAGCPQCGGTGYSGRTAIFEVLPMTDDFSRMVTKGESMQAVYRRALEEGLHTMRQDAAQKIRAGVTTCEEALRVTMA
ncbi:MAG: GspE/PulE family protein [Sutterella wadsworthensis]|nr:Flp pilus assembly complex ATPase component TadA [Sutterella wadsworthensis]MDY5224228.1 ATPase, T2SS/T4P/T4SS family [Sutterella wadsworthensis]